MSDAPVKSKVKKVLPRKKAHLAVHRKTKFSSKGSNFHREEVSSAVRRSNRNFNIPTPGQTPSI